MPDFDKYLMDNEAIDAVARAVDAWNRILRDPVSIVIVREGASLAAQTIRIESDSTTSGLQASSSAGTSAKIRHVIFGVKGHPVTSVVNTDVKRGDRFAYGGAQYEIKTVIEPPGEVQAFAESVT